ncbi:MAG: signal peptidase II, partial [Acidimicrobiales bacterium]
KGLAPLFMVGAIAVLVALIGLGRSAATSTAATVALGLVVGGALGNLADRFLRDFGGAVVDFIDLQWWPIFNVADAAISVGAVLLIVAGRPRKVPAKAGAPS